MSHKAKTIVSELPPAPAPHGAPAAPRRRRSRIIRAEAMGLCFGVRDALAAARAVSAPQEVTIHGQLVHNEAIVDELHRRGFASVDEPRRDALAAQTPAVLITAHGVSNAQRRQFEAQGKRVIDTTCPLVRRAHDAAVRLASEGRLVLVIGRRNHVEVLGLTGDLPRFEVVESIRDVRDYGAPRIGVVCQTTSASHDVGVILGAIRAANRAADIAFIDTVCQPTRDRQAAMEKLLDQVDRLVVVGGKASNNTQKLAARALDRGLPAHHVQGPGDIDPAWFRAGEVVGLTAGTSTPDEIIDAVERELARLLAAAAR